MKVTENKAAQTGLKKTVKRKNSKNTDFYVLSEEEIANIIDVRESIYEDFDVTECKVIFEQKAGMSFDTFCVKYQNKLEFYCNRLIHDQELAQDFTMETLMRALKKIPMYDTTKSAISTWVFSIACNACKQHLKEKSRFNVMSIDVELDTEGHTMKDFMSEDNTEDDYEINKEDYCELIQRKGEILLDTMCELKEPYYQILSMREFDGLSYAEIAKIQGVPEDTIKSRIFNGRAKLRKAVREQFNELDNEYLNR